MNLTFTRTRYGSAQGVGENGAVLFILNPSTARGDNVVHLRTDLPGIRTDIPVESPSKYDFGPAMVKAAQVLQHWAARQLGVALTVDVVDNTKET